MPFGVRRAENGWWGLREKCGRFVPSDRVHKVSLVGGSQGKEDARSPGGCEKKGFKRGDEGGGLGPKLCS